MEKGHLLQTWYFFGAANGDLLKVVLSMPKCIKCTECNLQDPSPVRSERHHRTGGAEPPVLF